MSGTTQPVRVRFAPSPTGFMHLGSVRTALMNYLFARQHQGTFILRIEDTDLQRNLDAAREKIFQDMAWLKLTIDEGPGVGGPHEPYLQSQRGLLYTEHLKTLIDNGRAYRCFCTTQELEEKRTLQIAQGKPPRYDRTCFGYSQQEIQDKLTRGLPFIWRFAVDHDKTYTIQDLAHGPITFDMKHFGDFTIARQDGTGTFIFVNFVDDMLMGITHVIRGQDHLSNTASQAALYHAFGQTMPLFWHLPIICSLTGEKMSKRDFGFSLEDLRNAGYLPEAILNYMALVGSAGIQDEVASLDELIQRMQFGHLHPTAGIKYDVAKLTWLNHQWIARLSQEELFARVLPFLHATQPTSKDVPEATLRTLVTLVATDLKRLDAIGDLLAFYFSQPDTTFDALATQYSPERAKTLLTLVQEQAALADDPHAMVQALSSTGKERGLSTKEVMGTVRYLLTGNFQGPKVGELLACMTATMRSSRLNNVKAPTS